MGGSAKCTRTGCGAGRNERKKGKRGEEKKVAGSSSKMLKERANNNLRTRKMVQWKRISQEGINDLWKTCAEGWTRRSWRSTESKKPGRAQTKDVVTSRMADCQQKEDISASPMLRRRLGWNFLMVLRTQLAAGQKYAGSWNRRGGDETAARDEDHDGPNEENQIKMQNGRAQPLVGQGIAGC